MTNTPPAARETVEQAFAKIPPLAPRYHSLLVIGVGSGALLDRIIQHYGHTHLSIPQNDATVPYQESEWRTEHGLPIWVIDPDRDHVQQVIERFNWHRAVEIGQLRFFTGPEALDELARTLNDPLVMPLTNWVTSPDITIPAEYPQQIIQCVSAAYERRKDIYACLSQSQNEKYDIEKSLRNTSRINWKERFASGKKLRVLVGGLRFGGTYLRHSCESLTHSFERLGHEVLLLIEQNDFQNTLPVYLQQTLNAFSPHLIVWINGCRSFLHSVGIQTGGAVFCSWLQDPPSMNHLRLPDSIADRTELDFYFPCAREWAHELTSLGYGDVTPVKVPTDPYLFSLTPPPDSEVWNRELPISSVSTVPPEMVEELFYDGPPSTKYPPWRELYRLVYRNLEHRMSVQPGAYQPYDYQEMLAAYLQKNDPQWLQNHVQNRQAIDIQLFNLEHQAGRVALRGAPLQWLAEAGHSIGIFGDGWKRHPVLGKHWLGTIPYGRPLAAMLRASKIHVCIHSHWTLTMKVLDSLAVGTFPLVRWVEPERETGPITEWFEEDREIVLFRTKEELLDKARFYLDHPTERQAITLRGREIALRRFTYDALAAHMLKTIRQ